MDALSLYTTIENYQNGACRMALFTHPDLANVITAMKSGASDILCASQERSEIQSKIKEGLSKFKQEVYKHSFVSQLAEALTEKALVQKSSLVTARREFSKTFLQRILNQQNMRRSQLASLMNISSRTLHRHLSA